MKKTRKKTPFKASDFLCTYQPKIKRIKTNPRQNIRKILRSFPPITLNEIGDQYNDELST